MADKKALYLNTDSSFTEVDPTTDGLSAKEFNVNNTSYGMSLDGSNNLVFDDGVTGPKTLAELSTGGGGAGVSTVTKDITSATTGTWSTGLSGTAPAFTIVFWDDSASKYIMLSPNDGYVSVDGSSSFSSVGYDTTGLTFNTNDYVRIYAHYFTASANASNEYDSDWITVSNINNTPSTDYHRIDLPDGFIDIPAGYTITRDNGSDIFPVDPASTLTFDDDGAGTYRVTVETTGWNSTDKFRLICSQTARPTGSSLYELQDFTTIGSISSVGQQFAGHQIEIVEPGTASGETLALYHFGSSGNAITVDEKGSYNLTDTGSVSETGGIFGGSTGAASFNGTSQNFTQSSLLDSATEYSNGLAIDFWISVNNWSPTYTNNIFGKENSSTEKIGAYINTSGEFFFFTMVGGVGAYQQVAGIQNYLNGGFVKVTLNWDTTNGKRVWFNDQFVWQDSSKTTLMSGGGSTDFTIAYYPGGASTNRLNGKLAYFRLRNKTLTQKDIDVAYATKYTWGSELPLLDSNIIPYVKEDGHDDFISQLSWGGMEVARNTTAMYRYGGILGSSDKLRITGRNV